MLNKMPFQGRKSSSQKQNMANCTEYYSQTSDFAFFINQLVDSLPVMPCILESLPSTILWYRYKGATSFLSQVFCQLFIGAVTFARCNLVKMVLCSVMAVKYVMFEFPPSCCIYSLACSYCQSCVHLAAHSLSFTFLARVGLMRNISKTCEICKLSLTKISKSIRVTRNGCFKAWYH